MFKVIAASGRWFVDGLTDVAIACIDRFAGPERYRVVLIDGTGEVHDGAGVVRGHLTGADEAARLDPPELADRLAGAALDIDIDPSWVFRQGLNPIAVESVPYLDAFVRHQIERVTPWRMADVHYSVVTGPMAGDPTRLTVELGAVPQRVIAAVVAVLTRLRPARLRLVAREADGDGAFVVPISDRSDLRHRRVRRLVGLGLVVAALLTAGSLGWPLWQVAMLRAEIADLDRQIEDRKNFLAAAAARDQSDSDLIGRLREARSSRPTAVELIDALSAALPDHAYLTELKIEKDRVRVSGVSRETSDLVPALESQHRFADVTFFAATTRLEAGGADRFHLELRVPGLAPVAPPVAEPPAAEPP